MSEKTIATLTRQLESIKHIGNVLSRTLNRDQLLHLIMSEVTTLMNADRSTLFLVDKQRNEIWSKIAQQSEIKEIRQTIGHGLSGWVAQHGKPLNVQDVYYDERFNKSIDKQTGYKTKSALTVPIYEPVIDQVSSKPNVIGVIQVLNKKNDDSFDDDDISLLESLGSQISISLSNAKLYNDLEEKVEELDFLFDVEKQIAHTYDLEQLLFELIEKLCGYIHAEAGSILLLSEKDPTKLYFRVATGPYGKHLKNLKVPKEKGIVGWVLQNNASLIVNEVGSDRRFYKKISDNLGMETNSVLCAPLTEGDHAIGVVELVNKTGSGHEFTDEDQKVLELISGQITRILETFAYREKKSKEDRMITVGNMISTVVHDLRSPMNIVMGFVDLMKETFTTEEKRQNYAVVIHKQIHRMNAMTNEILDFAKGKSQILPRKIGVSDLIRDYQESIQNEMDKSGVRFDVETFEAHLLIYADIDKLQRAFMNIQKNAVESFKNQTDKRFRIMVRTDETMVCFSLEDNGPGIPESIRENLFESFVTSGKENGTGLGLAIVKRIVDDHNGRIEIESSEKGTTFHIFIPLYNK